VRTDRTRRSIRRTRAGSMEKKRGLYSSNTPAYLAASGLIDSGGVETPGPAVSRGRRGAPIRDATWGDRDSGTGSTRRQQQRRSKPGACLKREERCLSPPLLRSASPPARLRLGLRSVTNQEAAKQRPFLLFYNILLPLSGIHVPVKGLYV